MDVKRTIRDRQLVVELFAVVNVAGLAGDIFLAHSQNHFQRASEYIPLYFSIGATAILTIGLLFRRRAPAVWRDLGHLVGWLAIVVGLAGVILHLDSRFFYERTIQSLTYAAPFAAPLAYTGLGLLLIANRLVDPRTREWSQWVLLLALGGFAGNFVFSLTDHAQNGFFHPAEWIPVVTSACAVGGLLVLFVVEVTTGYLRLCVAMLAMESLVGMVGFGLHLLADLRQPSASLLAKVLSGAPPLAPLLFVNLSILAGIALAARLDAEPRDDHRQRVAPRKPGAADASSAN